MLELARPSDSPYVTMVWHSVSEQSDTFISTAATHWEMVFTRHRGITTVSMRGPETKATFAPVPADAEWVGIIFRLGTFMPDLPLNCLLDRNDINLPLAAGNSFWLHGAAWELPTYENADTFVERLVRDGLLVHDPVVDAVLQNQPHDFSPRAVQYRFVQATGLTHKTIQQIERAKQAAALLEQGRPILDTVHETGYFDQAHLTNSLKRFVGQTPAQIVSNSQPDTIASD